MGKTGERGNSARLFFFCPTPSWRQNCGLLFDSSQIGGNLNIVNWSLEVCHFFCGTNVRHFMCVFLVGRIHLPLDLIFFQSLRSVS